MAQVQVSAATPYEFVEFVVGSLLCSEEVFSRYSTFPLPQKPTLLNFDSIRKARTSLNEFLRSPKCFVAEQSHSPSVNESSLKLMRLEKMIKKSLDCYRFVALPKQSYGERWRIYMLMLGFVYLLL